MRRQAMTWVGLGAALVLGPGAAWAGEGHKDKAATSQGASSSGAASSGTASSGPAASDAASSKELRGRVLQASPSRLFLEHMGAVVEFRIDSDAQFSGGGVKGASDLAEGQEVRASFTVENKTTNVAKKISVSAGMSGTGTSGQAPEQKPSTGSESAPPLTPGTPAPREPSTPSPK